MGHAFENHDELELDADPGDIWTAIATGTGQDAWFLGRNELGTGVGGQVRSDFAGGAVPPSEVTGWEPSRRLAFRSPTGDDGRYLASEYLIEGRAGGAVLRVVTSGFLPGDDWADELDAMRAGNCIFRASLAEAVHRFAGREAFPLTVFGPPVADWTAAWARLDDALGVTGGQGSPARVPVPGPAPVGGVLYARNEQVRGIRTDDALYRFIQGRPGVLVLAHVFFDVGPGDPRTQARPWLGWLRELLD